MDLTPYLAAFKQHQRDRGDAERTVWRYDCELRAFAAWLGGREVTEPRLHAYRRYLQAEKPNRKTGGVGLRPRSIRLAFTAIFSFVDWLVVAYGLSALPRRGCVKLPANDVAQREVPGEAEVRALFAAAEKVGLAARTSEYREYLRARALCVLTLLANCGLRPGECLSVRVSDLRRDHAPWLLHVREAKGAQPRWVPVNEEGQQHLRRWLAARAVWLARYHRESDALFPCGPRAKLGRNGFYGLFRELKCHAGLEERPFTPHGLRHSFATELLEVADIKTIQALLGHKSAQTTIDVYLHTSAGRMERAVTDLGKRRQPEPPPDIPPAEHLPATPERSEPPRRRWTRRGR
jgi:site-specific recombinase XerD